MYEMWCGNAGLAVFSKYPITRTEYKPFSFGYGGDAEAMRGVIMAEVDYKGSKLHFYNTHT